MRHFFIAMAPLCTTATHFANAHLYIGLRVGDVSAEDTRFRYGVRGGTETDDLHAGGGAVLDSAKGVDFDNISIRVKTARASKGMTTS